MRVTEAKYTRRYNTGNYEHEEFSLTAVVSEDENHVEVLAQLKSDIQNAYAGEAGPSVTEDAGTEMDETPEEEEKPAKRSKKSKRSRTTTLEDESDTEEEIGPEIEDETPEEEIENEIEDETPEEEIENEIEDESPEEEEFEAEEEPEPAPAKKTRSKSGAKGFKKKPQVYQRSNETHKDIFGTVLRKVAPNWKKSFESKAHAKKVSQKMEGVEFLDEDGKVLASFEADVKKQMGKFK